MFTTQGYASNMMGWHTHNLCSTFLIAWIIQGLSIYHVQLNRLAFDHSNERVHRTSFSSGIGECVGRAYYVAGQMCSIRKCLLALWRNSAMPSVFVGFIHCTVHNAMWRAISNGCILPSHSHIEWQPESDEYFTGDWFEAHVQLRP